MEVTTSERHASGGEAPELSAPNLVKAFYGVVDRLGISTRPYAGAVT